MNDTGLAKLLGNSKRTLDEANSLIDTLAQSLAVQGAAIIQLRERMTVQQTAIEVLANAVGAEEDKPNALIGFDKPKLEVN